MSLRRSASSSPGRSPAKPASSRSARSRVEPVLFFGLVDRDDRVGEMKYD
jgi:hypothetical protein